MDGEANRPKPKPNCPKLRLVERAVETTGSATTISKGTFDSWCPLREGTVEQRVLCALVKDTRSFCCLVFCVPHKFVRKECPTRVPYKSVKQKYCPKVSYKSVQLQDSATRASYKSVAKACQAMTSHKVVREECHPRMSVKSVFDECQVRVADKVCLFVSSYVCAFRFAGSI